MATFDKKTPGVYVEEISKLPPSVASVATAIPGFVGYTEKGVMNVPTKVESLIDFEEKFGGASTICYVKKTVAVEPEEKEAETVTEATEGGEAETVTEAAEVVAVAESETVLELTGLEYKLHESMRLFYANGGGTCYIVSVGGYEDTISDSKIIAGIDALETIDEVTMLVMPDAVSLTAAELASVQNAAQKQCVELKDRVAILDVIDTGNVSTDASNFRNAVNSTSYAAAYYPYLKSVYDREINFYDIVDALGLTESNLETYKQNPNSDSAILYVKQQMATPQYAKLVKEIQEKACVLPPSGAIAGIYCANDSQRGVWQAPANMNVSGLRDVNTRISDKSQAGLNVDTSGKSINAIRAFQGKGIVVWGARTLDGLSSEWKYISVRRFYNYVEESVQESTSWAVFQPNDANTWVKVRCQIENFLSNLWRDGALAGSTPQEAFFVRVGLNQTMTAQDILDGYMIVEIGMAAVRPAEFIVLQFSHKLQES